MNKQFGLSQVTRFMANMVVHCAVYTRQRFSGYGDTTISCPKHGVIDLVSFGRLGRGLRRFLDRHPAS